jgi:hexosaminidase
MLYLLSSLLGVSQAAASDATTPFWPQPQTFSVATDTLYVSSKFAFTLNQQSSVLLKASERYLNLISSQSPQMSNEISACVVDVAEIVDDEYATLQLGVDESYNLVVTSDGSCSISSKTVWGALHAFETFTQTLSRKDGAVFTSVAPIDVSDYSRFSHRGLMVDSSRHYLPVSFIQDIIDTLPLSKFNVLHWHMVDAQSFPVNTPSAPKMVNGAYEPSLTYSMEDISMLTSYAADRGVRLLLEVDIPGHAAAWTAGYPEIMADCFVKYSYNINDFALDPTQDATYDIVGKVVGDIIQASGVKNFHLGGDEVVYGCWNNDTDIVTFMEANGMSSDDLLEYFVLKADDITRSFGATPVHWEEVFKAGAKVGMDVIFEVWTSQDVIASVVAANYSVIAAPSDVWYLE